jgi:hypothetical protein
MLCVFSFTARDDGRYDAACSQCGRTAVTRTTKVTASCRVLKEPLPLQTLVDAAALARPGEVGIPSGPGTELKSLLRDWLGITASPGCSCDKMAVKMNALGAGWCESEIGMAEILGVMKSEHAKRWQAGKTILPWSDTAATALVRLACSRARAA